MLGCEGNIDSDLITMRVTVEIEELNKTEYILGVLHDAFYSIKATEDVGETQNVLDRILFSRLLKKH